MRGTNCFWVHITGSMLYDIFLCVFIFLGISGFEPWQEAKRAFALCSEIMEEGPPPPIALFYGSIKFHDIYESACYEADGLLAFI